MWPHWNSCYSSSLRPFQVFLTAGELFPTTTLKTLKLRTLPPFKSCCSAKTTCLQVRKTKTDCIFALSITTSHYWCFLFSCLCCHGFQKRYFLMLCKDDTFEHKSWLLWLSRIKFCFCFKSCSHWFLFCLHNIRQLCFASSSKPIQVKVAFQNPGDLQQLSTKSSLCFKQTSFFNI